MLPTSENGQKRRWTPAKEKSGLPMTTAHGKETGMAIPSHLAASASAKSEKGRSQACAIRNTSSINNASMPDLRNVTIASVGAQTIGSLSLKDVLTTSGTPVFAKKRDMSS